MAQIEENEVKKALEEVAKGFDEYKKVNDKRLEALAANKSTSDFDEKLDRINDMITKQSRVQSEWHRQQDEAKAKREAEEVAWKQARLEEERKFEARINRAALGLGGSTDEEVLKGRGIIERKAYDRFLRKGLEVLSADERKVLTVGTDTTGGYLAPGTYIQEIIKAIVEVSPFRGICNVRQIGTGEYLQPRRTGTAAATRVSEIGTRAETTNPSWGLLKIQAPEMYAEARISMQNLEDSAFNLEQELTDEFSEQFGVTEGSEVVNGNGVNKILGFLDPNAAGPATPIQSSNSGTAATIADVDGGANGIMDVFYGLKSSYSANGRWVLNRNTLGQLRKLKDANEAYIWQPGLVASAPPSILGAPYTEMPDMPNQAADAFPIAFGDWRRAFTLVDRIEMQIARDPFTVASVGQVKFTARRRVGGQVVLAEAIRLLKCAV